MSTRDRFLAAALFVLGTAAALAQEPAAGAPVKEAPGWQFNASVYGYFLAEDTDYGQPTVMANHEALHLEARYNYEGIGTGSAWIGWNFGFGEKFRLDATLMAGGVFGNMTGVAPGLELTLSWGPLQLYTEGEWVFETGETRINDNFFYNWAQLGYSPWDWLTVGFASQRTRTYRTGLGIQRGPFVGFTYGSVQANVYVFNVDRQAPTVVSSLAVSF